jgi:transposase InsO family protein
VAPNLLARHFDVDEPDIAWVGDIPYVWTAEGWLYVSTLLDLYSRKVVGWAMSSRINPQLVKDAFRLQLYVVAQPADHRGSEPRDDAGEVKSSSKAR